MRQEVRAEEHDQSEREEAVAFFGPEQRAGMTEEQLKEASSLYELFLVSGATREAAEAKAVELYSPPRVTAELAGNRGSGLVVGDTFDLRPNALGRRYDLSKASVGAHVRREIQRQKPYLVIGSPPCTECCKFQQNFNHHRVEPSEVLRRSVEARVHLEFCLEVYALQLHGGRHFLHAHPVGATSWHEGPLAAWLRARAP